MSGTSGRAGIPAGGHRIGPDVLNEVDELQLVDGRDRIRPVILRWLQRVGAGGEQRVADHDRALGRLPARDLATALDLDEAVVGEMVV